MFSPFFLWLSRASACLLVLCVASLLDLREREVPDKVWLLPAPLLASLTALSLLLGYEPIWPTTVSVLLSSVIGLLIYFSGLTGGADAKALFFLAIACPISHVEPLLTSHMLLPLAAFSNSLFFSSLASIVLLARNVAWRLKTRRGLFEDLGHVPLLTKVLVLISGYKMRAGDLAKARFVFPLEVLVGGEKGRPRRKLILVVRLREEEEKALCLRKALELGLLDEEDYVWVSPGLPLIVFLTAGFLTAVLLGDILFFFVLNALSCLFALF